MPTRFSQVSARKALSQSVTGNWAYMAPEMVKGLPYDGSVDAYSYGVVLAELVTRVDAGDDSERALQALSISLYLSIARLSVYHCC